MDLISSRISGNSSKEILKFRLGESHQDLRWSVVQLPALPRWAKSVIEARPMRRTVFRMEEDIVIQAESMTL